MCNACKHWKSEYASVQDFRQGAVSPEYGEEEVNYKAKKKDKRGVKKYPGCPGNDGKSHVYVWTTETQFEDFFYKFFGFHKYQARVCVGCGKTNGRKNSEQYEVRKEREWNKRYSASTKRGEPVPRWSWRLRSPNYNYWNWEQYHEEYVAKRREYAARHGYTEYWYGNF